MSTEEVRCEIFINYAIHIIDMQLKAIKPTMPVTYLTNTSLVALQALLLSLQFFMLAINHHIRLQNHHIRLHEYLNRYLLLSLPDAHAGNQVDLLLLVSAKYRLHINCIFFSTSHSLFTTPISNQQAIS